jgi:hypothetical protein
VAFNNAREWDQLKKVGVVTTGYYTELPRSKSMESTADWADYRFKVAGRIYTGTSTTSKGSLWGKHVGEPVEIRYLPSDPQVSGFANAPFPTGALTAALVFLGVAAIFGVGAFKLLWGAHNDMKMWRAAHLVWGEVVAVEPPSGEEVKAFSAGKTPSASASILRYSFHSPRSGQTIAGEESLPSATPEAPHPQAGRAVAVRYLDDENYRLL